MVVPFSLTRWETVKVRGAWLAADTSIPTAATTGTNHLKLVSHGVGSYKSVIHRPHVLVICDAFFRHV
jgi:hypothetical protein